MRLLLLAELRRHPLLHAAAALVVALLVAGVLALRATAEHAERSVHDAAHLLGKNMLVVPATADLAAVYRHRFGRVGMPVSHGARLRASPIAAHVRALDARLYGEVELAGSSFLLVGQEDRWTELPGRTPAALGTAAARRLAAEVGTTLGLGGRQLQVVALVPAGTDGLDDAVFVPLRTAQDILHRLGEISALRLGGCWCAIDVASLGREVERILPGTRAITVAGMLSAQKGSVAAMRKYGALLQVGGGAGGAARGAARVRARPPAQQGARAGGRHRRAAGTAGRLLRPPGGARRRDRRGGGLPAGSGPHSVAVGAAARVEGDAIARPLRRERRWHGSALRAGRAWPGPARRAP
jgi:hypothetical protein